MPAWPAWVHKRDGRLVPFEPDRISQALFAATESLGQPDAFLARELADGVLHFLAAETEGAIPSTAQIADTVVKVVRELGQPRLAEAFADFGRRRSHQVRDTAPETSAAAAPAQLVVRFTAQDPVAHVVQTALRTYSLQAVFARDLAAAHEEGLITLGGLDTPLHLARVLLEPSSGQGQPGGLAAALVEAITEARQCAGQVIAIDGPEYSLALHGRDTEADAAGYARELGIGLRAAGLGAVVNLNCAAPPVWAEHLAEGPLFAGHRRPLEPERREALAGALLGALLTCPEVAGRVRVDWHLGPGDLAPEAAGTLLRLARLGVESPAVAFVLDRPRRPPALVEGLDRRHGAVLLSVGLHLPHLLQRKQLGTEPELFLDKLGSLTRLALSAAARKREFLRKNRAAAEINRGFLLDRARLVVTPVGLEAAVRTLTGGDVCSHRGAAEFARKVVQRLRQVLRQDGPAYQLDAGLDGAPGFTLDSSRPGQPEEVAGLTPWDPTAAPKNQLRVAGSLHAAEAGTAAVVVSEDRPLTAEDAAHLLRHAGQQTDVVRVRFVRSAAVQKQLAASWEEGNG
jgi:hypothetical protein